MKPLRTSSATSAGSRPAALPSPPPPGISTMSRSPLGITWLPRDLSAGPDFRRTMPAAPSRRIVDALEAREDRKRRVLAAADLHHLAKPATQTASAAGIGAQLLPPDDEWGDRLGDLDCNRLHAGGKWRCRQPVELGMRAHAATLERL